MAVVTVSVPSELKRTMESFAEINWSAVARQAFARKVSDLEFLREMRRDSKLTEADAIRLGRKVNAALAKKYGG
ncbi:hypothetical protein COT29_03600 [Candidatus Micrarchaeota archaeon CG08_land_8_20_14_0_20_59_11]|nr:MAG: hypothetical protein COT29_03600 [Candidatus Micrarchaeota archaeon CG08_land_8_20_14_0_20_59_11]